MLQGQWIYVIVSTLIGISGWVKFIYDHIEAKPKIKARVLQVIFGQISSQKVRIGDIFPPGVKTTQTSLYQQTNEPFTVFLPYLYLVNQRKSAVHILDYEMEVDTGKGFEKLVRMYGVQNIPEWKLSHKDSGWIKIPDFPQKLIWGKTTAVEFGVPLYGFGFFVGKSSYYGATVKRYKITCIDVLGNRHKAISKSKDFATLRLLQDLAGIQFPTSDNNK